MFNRAILAATMLSCCVAVAAADEPNAPARRGETSIVGVWAHEGRTGRTEMVFAPDGTWRKTDSAGAVTVGRYSVKDGTLELLSVDGKSEAYKARVSADGALTLTDADGGELGLARQDAEPPATCLGVPRFVPYDNLPVRPRLDALAASKSGHILYTRYRTLDLGPAGKIPVRRIWAMTGEGKAPAAFIDPNGGWEAYDPAWGPDGKSVLFASNYEMPRSALYCDIFRADLTAGRSVRVTGAETPPPSKGIGSLVAMLHVPPRMDEDLGDKLLVTYQGAGGKVLHFMKGKGVLGIRYMPAGARWVKVWLNKHIGELLFVDIPVGTTLSLKDMINPTLGNKLATGPSSGGDGRYIVCLWQQAWYKPVPGEGETDDGGLSKRAEQGFDTIGVIDVSKGILLPVGMWEPTKAGGLLAKDPRVSPDGTKIVFSAGLLPAESIAVCSVADLLKGVSRCTILAQGRTVPGSGYSGNVAPAWSADGKRIAFVNYQSDLGGNFRGNLYVMNADGTGVAKVTDLAANQTAAKATWSPDGKRIAFQLVSSKREVLNTIDLLALNIRSDIYTISPDGSDARRLTDDGASADPAWGP